MYIRAPAAVEFHITTDVIMITYGDLPRYQGLGDKGTSQCLVSLAW